MISLLTPTQAQESLANNVRDRRLAMGLTQAGLAARSGVPIGTLRKFERTGAASVETLLKLLAIVGGLEDIVAASAVQPAAFASIDDVLEAGKPDRRKHGWRT